MALLHDLNNNTQNLKDKLNIELDQDCRVGKVVYGGLVMPAQVRNCVLLFTLCNMVITLNYREVCFNYNNH